MTGFTPVIFFCEVYMDKYIEFGKLICSISINNANLRSILDSAIEYQYGNSPIEFYESEFYRLLVNNIRHSHSNYESGLSQLHKLRLSEIDYYRYKNAVLERISRAYPVLKDECDNQKHKVLLCKSLNK